MYNKNLLWTGVQMFPELECKHLVWGLGTLSTETSGLAQRSSHWLIIIVSGHDYLRE